MRIILYIGIAILALFCSKTTPVIQSGDLLFVVNKSSDMTEAITAATGNQEKWDFSHVAILVAANGADSVLEASSEAGVRMVALRDFLAQAARRDGHAAVCVRRLRDTLGVAKAIARARSFIGQPYDYAYLPNNGKMYCSELVWESYLAPDGSHRLTARPMRFRAADGSMPQFWSQLFEQLGMSVPEGVLGTNPNDMAQEEILDQIPWLF